MADRNLFPVGGTNQPEMVLISCRLVFAADAQTNGCAVSKSNGFVTSCTRTAEGIWAVLFKDSYARCLGVLKPTGLTSGINCNATAQSVADSTPTVTLTFDTGTTAADVDPDGMTLDISFLMKNSKAAEGA